MSIKNVLQSLTKKQRHLIIAAGLILLVLLFAILNSIVDLYSHTETQTSQPTPVPSPTPMPKRVAGQVLVKFKQSLSQTALQEQLQKHNARILSTNDAIQTTVLEVPVGQEDTIIQQLTEDGLVEYAESNYIFERRRFVPNDPMFNEQKTIIHIQAPEAWDITRGAGVKVAIVDSGIDATHPDLASKILATNGNVRDTDGHGTGMAGIMGAATNNAVGVASICPECQLLIAKDGATNVSAASITWAADQGAKVINMSWGGSGNSKVLEDAINYAWNKGALPMAAVQNENINDPIDYPSSYANVMSVTNINGTTDVKVPQAGYGQWVWIAAPGEGTISTDIGGKYHNGRGGGTSNATPVTGAVAALVWSTPYGTSPQAVRQRVCDTADKIQGTGTQFKCGRVNAFKAVQSAAQPTQQPTAQPTIGGGVPSPQCLGGVCPTDVPSPTVPLPTQPVANPTQPAVNPTQPPANGVNPTVIAQIPTQAPNPGGGSGGNSGGSAGGVLGLLVFFLLLLLKGFLNIF